MKRRDIVLFAATALGVPRRAFAQQPERMHRVGYFTAATGSPEDQLGAEETRALVEGLRQWGWFDGRNITIDHRFSGGGRQRIQANARELVALNPEVILCVGGLQLVALLEQTRSIPIVFTQVADPVGSGFVASLARPGGNATGIGVNEAPLAGKWPQLLKEIAPSISRVLVLPEAESASQMVMTNAVADAAPSLGLALVSAPVQKIDDYQQAIEAFAREPGGGVVVLSSPLVRINRQSIHELAMQYRLPAVYSYPVYARTGGLLSYGPDSIALFREAAGYVDKILRGATPGDLPVQQPTRFVLAVNLRTAKALGLAVPRSILARADEVIE